MYGKCSAEFLSECSFAVHLQSMHERKKNVAESFVKNTPLLALSHKRTVYRIVGRSAVTASLLDGNKLQRLCVKVPIF